MRTRRRDEGFTLVELLMSVALSVILLLGLVGMMTTAFRGRDIAGRNVNDASAGQQLAVTLPGDAQSTFTSNVVFSEVPTGCAGASPGTNVVRFAWSQSLPTLTHFAAAYRLVPTTMPDGSSGSQVVRYFCSGPSLAAADPSTTVVFRDLAAASTSPVVASLPTTGERANQVQVRVTTRTGSSFELYVKPRAGTGGPGTPPGAQTPPEAPPAVLGGDMLDVNSDGKIDRLTVRLTKAVSDTTSCASGWALSGVPSGGTRQAPSFSGSTVTIPVAQGTGPADTAVGAFTFSFTPSAGCDLLRASSIAPTDAASPVLLTAQSRQGNTGVQGDGLLQVGDRLLLTWSEPIVLPSNSGTITEAANTVSITNITDGDVPTGGTYVASPTARPSFAASLTNAGSTTTVTAVGPCLPIADCAHLVAGVGDFSFRANAALQDSAGNSVAYPTGTTSIVPAFRIF